MTTMFSGQTAELHVMMSLTFPIAVTRTRACNSRHISQCVWIILKQTRIRLRKFKFRAVDVGLLLNVKTVLYNCFYYVLLQLYAYSFRKVENEIIILNQPIDFLLTRIVHVFLRQILVTE